jgi:negative regulator of flagellin synthesis FlgM
VSLTDTASRLRGLENTLARLPVIDSQRVEEVARSLADGSFTFDADRVAGKLLQFESELSR